MEKFILIKADSCDGDYFTEVTEISDEEILIIKEILNKMPKTQSYDCFTIRYKTEEIGDDDKEESTYNSISYKEKQFLDKFLPKGDYDFPGIHTIESVTIIKQLEELL